MDFSALGYYLSTSVVSHTKTSPEFKPMHRFAPDLHHTFTPRGATVCYLLVAAIATLLSFWGLLQSHHLLFQITSDPMLHIIDHEFKTSIVANLSLNQMSSLHTKGRIFILPWSEARSKNKTCDRILFI